MSAQRQPTRRDHYAICELTSQCRRLPSVTCKLKITTKRNPPFEYRRNRFPSPTPSFSLCVRRLWPRSSLICTTPRISIFYWINLPNGTIDVAKNEKKKKLYSNFCNGGLGVAPANGQTLAKLPIKQKIRVIHVLVGCPTHDLLIYPRQRKL